MQRHESEVKLTYITVQQHEREVNKANLSYSTIIFCSFQPFRNLSTSICLFLSSRSTPVATRKLSSIVSSLGMPVTVPLLRYFQRLRGKVWKRLRLRGYPYRFLLPLFREIRYSDRKRWFKSKDN